jgi:hypothetical protein
VRDFVAFLRHATADADGTPNPLARSINWSIATGLSQSGRFHRPFLHLGFNQDEQGRRVFDGMMPYINGAGGGFFNHRFGQPNRTAFARLSHVSPEQGFPFAYSELTDPITGKTDSVLARCGASGTCPKIMEVNDSNSYWFKSAALAITTPTARVIWPIRITCVFICFRVSRMASLRGADFASSCRIRLAPVRRCERY